MSSSARKKEERLDAVFHALADTTRRKIVARLSSEGSVSVGELAAAFKTKMSLAAVSKHLTVLEDAGVIERAKEGRFQRCSLMPGALENASQFIDHYRAFWSNTLDDLADYLERGEKKAHTGRR
jgi:DNA-binding transcriptional ArsR family regulator